MSQEIHQLPSGVMNELLELERQLTQPETRRSREILSRLVADDFREFGGSGREFTRQGIMDALQGQPEFEIEIGNFEATAIGDAAALVTYRATCRVVGSEMVLRSLRSSIWLKREGRWQIRFHQGTPMSGSPSRIDPT